MAKDSQDGTISTLDVTSQSSDQTRQFGKELGEMLEGGELILLEGQLGAGKTALTQGLAQGLGIQEIVSSPTFTILKEYAGRAVPSADPSPSSSRKTSTLKRRPALYHFDLYRLEDPEEIFNLGFDEYFSGLGVSVVEWAGNADPLWPDEHLHIRLVVLDETKRELYFTATGARYRELLTRFQKKSVC